LNFSVFLHDTMNDKVEAIKRAKSTLHAALRDTEEITDNNQKDIILICQMIKDNLSLWKNEIPEELNNL
jgi:ribosomal protein L7/L12